MTLDAADPARARPRDAQGGAPPPPRRLAPDRHGARDRPDPRGRGAARRSPGCATSSSAPDKVRTRPSCSPRSTCRSRSCRTPRRSSGSRSTSSRTRHASSVRYAEVRWAPLLHTDKGLSGRQVVDAVWKGSAAAARRSGIEVRLIATLMRRHPRSANLEFVRSLRRAASRSGLVAVDLAGPEARYPDPALHRDAIEPARSIGLHVTRPRRRVGRRGPGAAVTGGQPGADRARATRDRGPGAASPR